VPAETPALILRLLRGRANSCQRAQLLDFVRQHAITDALRLPGLVSFQPAVAERDGQLDVMVASAWQGFDELAAVNQMVTSPMPLSTAEGLITDARIDHYELALGAARMLPLNGARMRVALSTLKPNSEGTFFERVRNATEAMLDTPGLIAFLIGRRVGEGGDEIAAVTLWDADESIRTPIVPPGGAPLAGMDVADLLTGAPVATHYDALVAVEPAPDAPAILVVDDTGHYIHATRAASQLTGWPLARLLTMQVADLAASGVRPAVPRMWEQFIAEGTRVGEFDVRRPDGSVVAVNFAARANTPWPGSHVSILTDRDAHPVTDIDRALIQAGILARYENLPTDAPPRPSLPSSTARSRHGQRASAA
jgi:PAS domain S-box-containing protein